MQKTGKTGLGVRPVNCKAKQIIGKHKLDEREEKKKRDYTVNTVYWSVREDVHVFLQAPGSQPLAGTFPDTHRFQQTTF